VSAPEVWLRGPVAGVPQFLQPVAHCLLQCAEEVRGVLVELTPDQIITSPGGAATIGYHVTHAIGSMDRLFTYARGEGLSLGQVAALAAEREGAPARSTGTELADAFDSAVEQALTRLRNTDESSLLEPREVGKARLPSTVLGLLFHAAEHTHRHTGQIVTTARVVRAG